MLAKNAIFDKKSIVIVQGEVDVLARMDHPFIIHLFAVYQVRLNYRYLRSSIGKNGYTDTSSSRTRPTSGYGRCYGYWLLLASSNVNAAVSSRTEWLKVERTPHPANDRNSHVEASPYVCTHALRLLSRYSFRKDEHRVALVMEYAAGGELLHRIRQRPRLPETEAKFYAAEIADALQHMHKEVGCVGPL